MGPQRPEEMDRQFSLVRHLDHLGARSRRRPSQGVYRRETRPHPVFKVEKIQNKIALKVVQNGLITMENCRVPEENRLQNDQSFRDTARVLKMTRFMVGWEATGCAMGAYEKCAQVLPGAVAVRQADRLIPDGARPPGQNARQHHRVAVPLGAHVPARGRRQDDGRACIACQGLHYRQMSRDGRVGA